MTSDSQFYSPRDLTSQSQKIVQLYKHLELFSQGHPPHNTLFILGRSPLAFADLRVPEPDQLLLVDPPSDSTQRFRLTENVAALSTTASPAPDLPAVHTEQGGIAHIRIGEHLLDVYSQTHSAVVHIPALGLICSGDYGSDHALPMVGPKSQGQEELDTLRLLARLVKSNRIQLLIPRVGTICRDRLEAIKRLAADVSYLHSLRRVIPTLAQRAEPIDTALSMAHTLLPPDRRSDLCRSRNRDNIVELYRSARDFTD